MKCFSETFKKCLKCSLVVAELSLAVSQECLVSYINCLYGAYDLKSVERKLCNKQRSFMFFVSQIYQTIIYVLIKSFIFFVQILYLKDNDKKSSVIFTCWNVIYVNKLHMKKKIKNEQFMIHKACYSLKVLLWIFYWSLAYNAHFV